MPTLSYRLTYAAAVLALLAAGGCLPSPLGSDPAPDARIAVPTTATHYRGYNGADGLSGALRWWPGAPRLVSAHRGGPRPGLPENSIPTFEHALNYAPALIETDVRRTVDGTLVLMHDETLDRTTTGAGEVGARTLSDIRALRLVDETGAVTSFRVPTLDEALAWAEGRAVLLLDVKPGVPAEAVVGAIRRAGAEGRAVVIGYSLESLLALHRMAPDLMLSATVTTPAELDALLAAPVDRSRLIAFGGVGSVDASLVPRLHAEGIRVQVGTFGARDAAAAEQAVPTAYDDLLLAGVDVLATDNVPAAAAATRAVNLQRLRGVR